MKGKKGLSDVVTTVLIILLVVAAVSAIWMFIQPTLKNAGKSIDKATVCITSTVNPISCKKSTTTNDYTVAYSRNTDNNVQSVSAVNLVFELADGTVVNLAGDSHIANGASSSNITSAPLATTANQVTISTTYTLADGSTQLCQSSASACTA
ncbi:MAG: hypothetical protein AABX66_00965 [Nanoarchaeota archaeon]